MILQIVRAWVVKFNAEGPAGLINRKAPGPPSRLNATHRAARHIADGNQVDNGMEDTILQALSRQCGKESNLTC